MAHKALLRVNKLALYDQSHMPTGGHWTWKDDTKTLEYVSNNPNADKTERKRERRQAKEPKKADRVAGKLKGLGLLPPSAVGLHLSKSPTFNKRQEPHNVTLQNVKAIALSMLPDTDAVLSSFHELYQSEQCDTFLIYLMNYFACFFEKRAREKQPDSLSIEPSISERKSYAELCTKLAHAQRLLGQAYGTLVLGIGTKPIHHMSCGTSRVSNTEKDRKIYETMYAVSEFVVWIAFWRKEDYDVVRKEIGRMLRSDTFATQLSSRKPTEDSRTILTPAEYRRQFLKRPAIKSIITQRSPALISILPTTKENATFLFKKQNKTPDALATFVQSALQDSIDFVDQPTPAHLDPNSLRIGIIGEPLSHFNPITLTHLGADAQTDVDTASSKRKESVCSRKSSASLTHDSQSHMTGATSRATSDAVSDSNLDEDD